MGVHAYGYYDTHTHPIHMQVLKVPVLVTRGYPFTISISYPLRVLSVDICRYEFFWHP